MGESHDNESEAAMPTQEITELKLEVSKDQVREKDYLLSSMSLDQELPQIDGPIRDIFCRISMIIHDAIKVSMSRYFVKDLPCRMNFSLAISIKW